MKDTVVVSVRNMVEFILRSGDIDGGFTSVKRAQEGTRLHQKLQKKAIDEFDYQKEVPLAHIIEKDGIALMVEGRADGIFEREDLEGPVTVIDEIKSVNANLSRITIESYPLHWAQAACYAYIYALQEKKERMEVRLTYIHAESEEVRYLYRIYSMEELETFFMDVTERYMEWIRWHREWCAIRNQGLQQTAFPYERFREGQRTMAAYIYKAIRNQQKAFLQAPTGIGKTISALFPAMKAMGEGLTGKIFYLTAKHTTGLAAMAILQRMLETGTPLKVIELTAKDSMCPLEKRSCHPEDCPYARGHFDRINDAVMELLRTERVFTSEKIRQWGDQYQVCPFELSLDLSSWSDVIVCDYNYAFDPSASLKRFFSEMKTDHVLLVDEAHNLVDRAREMYSASLIKESYLALAREWKKTGRDPKDPLIKATNKVNKEFLHLKKSMEDAEYKELEGPPESLLKVLKRWCDELETVLAESGGKVSDAELDLYFDSLFFLKIADQYGEGYVTYLKKENNELKLRMFCYHPAQALKHTYEIIKSCIFFSATLTPAIYYKELLGAEEEDAVIDLPSPYDPRHKLVMTADQVQTTYQKREQSIPQIVELIHKTGEARKGNYFVFFPSFAYLNQVLEQHQAAYEDDTIIIQKSPMTDEERQQVLDRMQADGELRFIYAVLGGVFSESIDLQGDRVIGSIVVTVGLPQIGFERDLIRDSMEKRNGQGFDYAYAYPGIGKVLQAAGRVIRTETDRGMILLIDSRYGSQRYQKMLPHDWYPIRRVTEKNIQQVLQEFWEDTCDIVH